MKYIDIFYTLVPFLAPLDKRSRDQAQTYQRHIVQDNNRFQAICHTEEAFITENKIVLASNINKHHMTHQAAP